MRRRTPQRQRPSPTTPERIVMSFLLPLPPPPAPSDLHRTIIPPPQPTRAPRLAIATISATHRKKNQNATCSWCLTGTDPVMGICKTCYVETYARLNSPEWRALSRHMLALFPICHHCHIRDAEDVHHVKPWRFFPSLFISPENLITLCAECHTKHYTHKENNEVILKYAPTSGG
jgi:5-methylcytosine-specific restriction endonuclease McrA